METVVRHGALKYNCNRPGGHKKHSASSPQLKTEGIGMGGKSFYNFGPFRLDPARRVLLRDGKIVPLMPKALDLLVVLVENAGSVVPKEELIKAVWQETFIEEGNLTQNISILRKALGSDPAGPAYVETIPKRGYRFLAPVRVEDETRGVQPESYVRAPAVRASGRRIAIRAASLTLLLAAAGGLFLIATKSREHAGTGAGLVAVPLTTLPGREMLPTLSPDGNQVAFVWDGNGGIDRIYVKTIDAENLLHVTNPSAGADYSPAWSPDGRWLAFERLFPEDRVTVLLIPAIGGPERKLADVPYGCTQLAKRLSWSPDGKWVAFTMRAATTGRCSVFAVSTGTGETRQLTFPPAGSRGDAAPALSPDGRSLVFARSSTEGLSELYLLPLGDDLAPKGEPKQLTSLHRWTVSPAWLPNSREIVFGSGEANWIGGGAPELWRMSVSGAGAGEPHRLLFAGEPGGFPDISRRGNRLAYTRGSVNANIWKVDLGGRSGKPGQPVKLISSTRIEKDPQYSPDGQRIAFISSRSGALEVWVAGNDGSDPIRLTSMGATRTEMPRWSPDGTRIVFDSNRGGRLGLYLISANGGTPHGLNDSGADEVAPSWSADGRYIYFGSDQAGVWQIWKRPVEGGRPVQVTRNGGYGGFESLDGRYFYYSMSAWETSLWRAPAGGGEEVRVLESLAGLGFAVVNDGIYFERPLQDDTRHYTTHSSVQFLDFMRGDSRAIAKIQTFFPVPAGLSVSPDRRHCIYTQLDDFRGELMLVDNFR